MSSNQAGVYRGGNTTGTTGTTGGVTDDTPLRNTTGTAGTGVVSAQRGEPICDQKYYTKVEDRPIVKEQVTYVREHHPMEKEFIVETRPTGRERELTEGRTSEVINTEEKIIEVTPRDPCAGVEPVGGHIGSGVGHHGHHHGHHSGVGGTGVGSNTGVGGVGSGTGTGVGGTGVGRSNNY